MPRKVYRLERWLKTLISIRERSCSCGPYRLLYLDPPWRFKNWSMDEMSKYGEKWARRNGRSPYPVMTTEDMAQMPIGDLGYRHSLMAMWVTSPKFEEGLFLLNAYRYEFVTVLFTWIKLNPSGVGWHFGLGYHSHQNAEYCILGKRGQGVRRRAKDVFSLVWSPRGEHSAKPDEVRCRLERLYGNVPRLELYACQQVEGWDTWGNETQQSPTAAALLDKYVLPPYQAIVDEDEYQGQDISDTEVEYQVGDQMMLM